PISARPGRSRRPQTRRNAGHDQARSVCIGGAACLLRRILRWPRTRRISLRARVARWSRCRSVPDGRRHARRPRCQVTAAPAGGGLAEVLAVLAKATPGEWFQSEPNYHTANIGISGPDYVIADMCADGYGPDTQDANAAALTAAVNYLRSHG